MIRVFVASPGDVSEERVALEDVVRDLNVEWARTLGLRLELDSWLTAGPPGIGDYPQAVINEAVGDDYDVFVGILWTRFGTPTPRAGSGTAEEFQRAYARYQGNPDSVRVMMYFSDAQLTPSAVNPDELRHVQVFRESLGAKGVLWASYSDLGQFTALSRLHLTRVLQSFLDRLGGSTEPPASAAEKTTAGAVTTVSGDAPPENEDEEGYFELLETFLEDITGLTTTVDHLNKANEEVAARLNQRSAEWRALGENLPSIGFAQAKRVASRAAEDMVDFAAKIEAVTPEFSRRYSRLIDRVPRLALLEAEQQADYDRLEAALSAAKPLLEGLTRGREAMGELRGTANGLPRISKDVIRAKRQVVSALDALISEMDKGKALTEEAIRTLSEARASLDGRG